MSQIELAAFVVAFIVAALALFFVALGQSRLRTELAAISTRLTILDEATLAARESSQNAREAKEIAQRLLTELGDARGRIASILEAHGKLTDSIATLGSALPLQVSEGLNELRAGLASGQAVTRQEAAERADRNAKALMGRLDSGFLTLSDLVSRMRAETAETLRESANEIGRKMEELRAVIDTKLGEIVTRASESSVILNETAQRTVTSVTDRLTDLKASVDTSLKQELGAIRTDNATKLEEIRHTVDEKLHATLEQRLGESFKIVSDRLELVHRGLGEMQSLATGVGDLKKVLTNVRTRGTWGEVQLDRLLDQILTPEQYGKNVATKVGSAARVEFAIRLPGRTDSTVVWLPIDAKFPMEDYQRLLDAQERGDLAGCDEAGKALEGRIKMEAKSIRDKYIDPPNTTDFAILYLPTEGLYAEVLRRQGLSDWVQRECKINVAGPTTLAALMNSLQMGFRTLAIERRSSEVWGILGTVKAEFGKFGDALAHTKKKLEEAHSSLESTEQRNRALTRKLRGVDALPSPEVDPLKENQEHISAIDDAKLDE